MSIFFKSCQKSDQNIPRDVMLELIDLAIEIAREGREGRRIGTLFVIGDEDEVYQYSRCLILDPLLGHPKAQKKLTDPNLRETVKDTFHLRFLLRISDSFQKNGPSSCPCLKPPL